jgi:hypothetical protein
MKITKPAKPTGKWYPDAGHCWTTGKLYASLVLKPKNTAEANIMIMRIPLLRTVCKAIVAKADWDESKHPRADNGQFGSGSGGSSKPKKPSKTRRKMERREEAASQARVGGAIQSLLSGGSALDKIGWLNTSKKPSENEKKPEQQGSNSIKNPPHVDMSGVPKDKALITGSVSVSYDTKVPTKHTRFSGGEDSPSGEHAHSEDAGYKTVPNVENFIHVQTHDGKSGWYPDIYNNTRRTNYYPGSKEDALTDIAAHPGAPKADELHPTLADAIASIRSIPKDYKIAPHKNKPPKPFDGAAVLEEYYRKHPDERPPEAKPKEEAAPAKEPSRQEAPRQPEKPKAEEKPKEESDVDRHQRLQAERKQFIQDSSAKLLANLRSGKVTPEDAEKVKRELGHKSFDLVREMRPMKDGDELDAKIAEGKHIDDKIEAIDAALKAHKDEQPTKPIDWSKVRSKPGGSSVRDDPLPKGYGVRSPEETERYMREHPRKPPKPDDYEEDYKRRTGRDWDPTTA